MFLTPAVRHGLLGKAQVVSVPGALGRTRTMGTSVHNEEQTDPAGSALFPPPRQVIEWLHFINANNVLV